MLRALLLLVACYAAVLVMFISPLASVVHAWLFPLLLAVIPIAIVCELMSAMLMDATLISSVGMMRRNAAVRQVVLEERALRMLRALQMLQSMSIKVSSLSPPTELCPVAADQARVPAGHSGTASGLVPGSHSSALPGSAQANQRQRLGASRPNPIGRRTARPRLTLTVFRVRCGGSCANSLRSHCATRRRRLSCRPQSCTSCRHPPVPARRPHAHNAHACTHERAPRGALCDLHASTQCSRLHTVA